MQCIILDKREMKLSKGIIQVIIANILNLIISLGNGFLLPKYLSVESYAALKTFLLYFSYVGVLHFGYIDGIYIKYGGKTFNEINRYDFAYEKRTLALLQLVFSVPAAVISLCLNDLSLLFATFSILPINMVTLYKFIYQATGEFNQYRKITNLSSILIFLANMFLLFFIKTGKSIWYIVIQVTVSLFIWIYYEYKNRTHNVHISITIKGICYCIKENISLGIIIMFGNFMGIWITSIDRWFVKALCGVAEFAYYSFAVTMLRLINVVVTAFSVTLYNFFCKEHSTEAISQLRRIVLIIGSVIIAAIFPVDFIVQIFLDKYIDAVPIIRLLFMAQFVLIEVNAIYLNLYKALNLQKKYLVRMGIITVIALLSNGVFGYLWNYDINAYAVATLFTSFVWLILCQIDLPEYKMSRREWAYILYTITAYYGCNFMNECAGLVFYPGVILIGLLLIFPKDIKTMFSMLQEIRNKESNE